jgi:pyruvate,orthophosphate dikinase
LRVLTPDDAKGLAAADLEDNFAAADPEQIGAVLAGLKGAKGARGGAIASDDGVRAAIAAGLDFIIAQPVLPPLLAAVRAALDPTPTVQEKERA